MKARIKSGTVSTPSRLTIGKWYDVTSVGRSSDPEFGRDFTVISDTGDSRFCLEYKCAHLMGGSWELVEEKKSNKIAEKFRKLLRLNK